jgi:hypothetical protein
LRCGAPVSTSVASAGRAWVMVLVVSIAIRSSWSPATPPKAPPPTKACAPVVFLSPHRAIADAQPVDGACLDQRRGLTCAGHAVQQAALDIEALASSRTSSQMPIGSRGSCCQSILTRRPGRQRPGCGRRRRVRRRRRPGLWRRKARHSPRSGSRPRVSVAVEPAELRLERGHEVHISSYPLAMYQPTARLREDDADHAEHCQPQAAAPADPAPSRHLPAGRSAHPASPPAPAHWPRSGRGRVERCVEVAGPPLTLIARS